MKFKVKINSAQVSILLKYALLAGALLYILVYLYVVFSRIRYPFELEWVEGGSIDHVRRIIAGQKLYIAPSLEFTPYIYPPFYYHVSAIVSKIVGIGFLPLRLVSFISSLGSFFFIFRIVKLETKDIYSGIIATGLFAATYRISGAWLDIGRVDSLYLMLLLAAIYLIRFKNSPTSYILAGILISLSFLTKQTALAILLPLIIYCILTNWHSSIFFIGTTVIIIGGNTLFLNYIHDGWYYYYVFSLPTQHPIIKDRLIFFWSKDIMSSLAIAFGMSIFYVSNQLLKHRKEAIFYFLIAVGMLGSAWIPRLKNGGYDNTLLPACAIISILFGLALHEVINLIQDISTEKKDYIKINIYLLCIIQFFSLIYSPSDQIPPQYDLRAGRKVVRSLAQIEGDILMPYHSYLPTLAGKRSFAHWAGMWDILRGDEGDIKTKLADEIVQAIAEKRFSAIILDDNNNLFIDDIEKNYERHGQVFENDYVFWPVTGFQTRPEIIYFPKDDD